MGFKKSLEIGNKGQKIVIDLLTGCGFDCEVSKDKCVGWDISVVGPITFLAEIKYDLYAAKSGNICIEYHNSKNHTDSGIMGTEANLWFHVFHNPAEVWVTSVPKLLQYCMDVKPFKQIICGGNDNSDMLLYRKEVIRDIFVVLNTVEQESIVGTLKGLLDAGNTNG